MDAFDMELKLYDTLSREKRTFVPIDPSRVRMYVCGPTVYDYAHIGNARPVIVFDVLFRLLRHVYGENAVTYVRNITDVDDKINARAAERGIDIRELTNETYKNFKNDVAALGCLPPTIEPRATEHIEEMKALIERLVKSGNAYVAEDNVLFNVPSMPDYGKLSNRPLDEMIAGARVEVAPYKKDPQDFVLWKPSKPGEPGWPSPAGIKGMGRPGWHIECSAMAWKHLGETFDIHGGGIDLVFPHHENEIAQSRCSFNTGVMANYWMHNGFLQVEGEKMSKSVGNFITIHELLADWPGEVVRLNMLRSHYRQPIDWTVAGLTESKNALRHWANILDRHQTSFNSGIEPERGVLKALSDDLNTPMALAEMHKLADHARKGDFQAAQKLHSTGEWLGVITRALMSSSDMAAVGEAAAQLMPQDQKQEIEKLIDARTAARAAKDFKESDRIRDELAAMGVVLKDSKDGTTWEVAR
jgi:cysteinyl-tRNA synthetase